MPTAGNFAGHDLATNGTQANFVRQLGCSARSGYQRLSWSDSPGVGLGWTMRTTGRALAELLGVLAAGFLGYPVMLAYVAGFLLLLACGFACAGFLLEFVEE